VLEPGRIENSRRVAQQRGSKRGSPGRDINTDQVLISLQYTNALILNAIATSNLSSEFIFMINAIPA
jgi:hypothetical protein